MRHSFSRSEDVPSSPQQQRQVPAEEEVISILHLWRGSLTPNVAIIAISGIDTNMNKGELTGTALSVVRVQEHGE